jgi:hypothetical protein
MLPKLLIVEDDPDGRDALAEIFRLEGASRLGARRTATLPSRGSAPRDSTLSSWTWVSQTKRVG